jgi:putative transcriptional regulator
MTMARNPSQTLMPIVAALLFFAVAAAAAEQPLPPEPAPGQLLVAAATMQDPRFARSVILLLRHDKTGAFGLIINRPIAERPLADMIASIGKKDGKSGGASSDPTAGQGEQKPAAVEGSIRVFFGGPVQPQFGFVIHGSDYHRPETLAVGSGLAMTASRDVLLDIAHHKGPGKYLFALGYAGWGPGQLEGEVARRDWFTAPADPDLLFDAPRDKVWDKALASRTREL